MKKIIWLVKQLLPCLYYTKYGTPDGVTHIAIWRMWLGKCFNVLQY